MHEREGDVCMYDVEEGIRREGREREGGGGGREREEGG